MFTRATRLMILLATAAGALSIGMVPAMASTTPSDGNPDTYNLTSSQYTVSADPLKLKDYNATCGDGFHVGYTVQYVGHLSQKRLVATVTSTETDHAKGDIYVLTSDLTKQIGNYPNGTPYFSTVDVRLGNHSWSTDHTGTFTWSCVANPTN